MNGAILLVDDDGEDASLIQEAFEKAGVGAAFRRVKSAEEALEYFEGSGSYKSRELFPLPGLVLLDVRLPGMSGLELLEWIRKQSLLKGVVVVVLTGLQLDGEIQRAYLLGANSILFKGVTQKHLDAKVSLLIKYWLEADQPSKLCA